MEMPAMRSSSDGEGNAMKTNMKLIDTLNQLLADELTGISEYMVHAEMCDEWADDRLYDESAANLVGQISRTEEREHQEFN
jgi:bacterioferritin